MTGPAPSSMTARAWRSRRAERLRRPAGPGPDLAQALAGALGVAAPVAAGVLAGNRGAGVAAALGGLVLGGSLAGERPASRWGTMVLGTLAVLVGAAVAGRGYVTVLVVPAIAGAVALLGGISRPLARASGRILPLIVIATSLDGVHVRPGAVALLFALGGAWTILVARAVHRFVPAASGPAGAEPPPKVVPWRYLVLRWRGTLRTVDGWRFAIRIASCLLVAEAIALHWGRGHGQWIALTVVLVVQRDVSAALARTLERSVGTLLGVVLGGLFLASGPSPWASVIAMAALAAARPFLRSWSYAAYAAGMTPLVLLLLDPGGDLASSLVDRLLATLIGCVVALALGYFPWAGKVAGDT